MPDTSEDTAAAAALSRIVPDLNILADTGERFGTILVDPPWRFTNRTGKVAPEHKRLHRYETMTFAEIDALPVEAHWHRQRATCTCGAPMPSCTKRSIHESMGFHLQDNIVWLEDKERWKQP